MTPERFSSYPASSISLTTCPWPLGIMYFSSQSWFFLLLKPWLCRFKGAFTNSKSVWIYHFNRAHQNLSRLSVADCSVTQITDWDTHQNYETVLSQNQGGNLSLEQRRSLSKTLMFIRFRRWTTKVWTQTSSDGMPSWLWTYKVSDSSDLRTSAGQKTDKQIHSSPD